MSESIRVAETALERKLRERSAEADRRTEIIDSMNTEREAFVTQCDEIRKKIIWNGARRTSDSKGEANKGPALFVPLAAATNGVTSREEDEEFAALAQFISEEEDPDDPLSSYMGHMSYLLTAAADAKSRTVVLTASVEEKKRALDDRSEKTDSARKRLEAAQQQIKKVMSDVDCMSALLESVHAEQAGIDFRKKKLQSLQQKQTRLPPKVPGAAEKQVRGYRPGAESQQRGPASAAAAFATPPPPPRNPYSRQAAPPEAATRTTKVPLPAKVASKTLQRTLHSTSISSSSSYKRKGEMLDSDGEDEEGTAKKKSTKPKGLERTNKPLEKGEGWGREKQV